MVDVLALRNAVDAAGYGDIPIIEDCAQAQGARLAGRHAGAMGDIAAFSFYPTKNLGALGDAGAVATSDPDLYGTLRQLHQYGWSEKYQVAIAGGRNSRMDEAQASVLTVLLPHLDEMNRGRVAILAAYREAGSERLRFLEYHTGTVAHLAVGLCPETQAFRRFMEDRGIATAIHYPILDCDQLGWRNLPQRIGPVGLSVSRRSVPDIVSLPCFPFMTDDEVSYVVAMIKAWVAR